VVGLSITYWNFLSPGATIVVLAIGTYLVVALLRPLWTRRRPRVVRDPHPDIPDDVDLPDARLVPAGTPGADRTTGDDQCSA